MQLLRFTHRHGKVILSILELRRQFIERLAQVTEFVFPKGPIQSLRRDIGSGDNADIRVDEEHDQALGVAFLGWVG